MSLRNLQEAFSELDRRFRSQSEILNASWQDRGQRQFFKHYIYPWQGFDENFLEELDRIFTGFDQVREKINELL